MARSLSVLQPLTRRIVSPSLTTVSSKSRRWASTHDHDHHGHDTHGTHEHRPEGFFTPFWRNTIIISILGYGIYQVLPSRTSVDGKEASLTSFIRSGITSAEVWKERNESHLMMTVQSAEHKLLADNAQRPLMMRTRNPGKFDDASPHRQQLGEGVDFSSLNIKSDSHMLKPAHV